MTENIQETPVAEATPVANGFAVLGLAPELLAAVADLGFTQPMPVQQQAIGRAMAQDAGGRRLQRPDGLQPDRAAARPRPSCCRC
jgi:superfamily II DNA/RNA helicase